MMALDQLWERLGGVRRQAFVARSGRPGGWNGAGSGPVVVGRGDETTMTFTEAGVWRPEGGPELDHTTLHARSSCSMRSTSVASRRKSNTSRSSRTWPASVVPVRGTMPTSRANRKTTWLTVRP